MEIDTRLDASFLESLPNEVQHRILFDFCDGKMLSSLFLAGPETVRILAWNICQERLVRVARVIQSSSTYVEGDRDLRDVCNWINAIAFNDPPLQDMPRFSKILSENAMVMDFLEESLQVYSNLEAGFFEWVIWCGCVCVESFHTGKRIRQTAAVTITSPMQQPSLLPGASLIQNRNPFGLFRCEPYNMVPIPPWGRVHPMTTDDAEILQPVVSGLGNLEQAAVPFYTGGDSLDIRIITRTQARNRSTRIRPPKTSWLIEQPGTELVCCWQDDSDDIQNPREYVDYIYNLLKVRQRLAPFSKNRVHDSGRPV